MHRTSGYAGSREFSSGIPDEPERFYSGYVGTEAGQFRVVKKKLGSFVRKTWQLLACIATTSIELKIMALLIWFALH